MAPGIPAGCLRSKVNERLFLFTERKYALSGSSGRRKNVAIPSTKEGMPLEGVALDSPSFKERSDRVKIYSMIRIHLQLCVRVSC